MEGASLKHSWLPDKRGAVRLPQEPRAGQVVQSKQVVMACSEC